MTPLLEVQGLCAGYGRQQVLHGLDFSVDEGEVVVVLGANGAGKTTTLRALSAMIPWRGMMPLAAAAIVVLLLRNLVHGRVGRALVASRDHEIAARSVGVNLAAYRIIAFGLSAAITAFGGTLFVMQTGFVSSTDSRFTLVGSLMLVVAVVLGGTGTVAGPVLGAVAVVFLPPLLSDLSGTLSLVLLGVVLIAFMYAAPGGVVGLYRAVRTRLVVVVRADSPAAGRSPQRHVHSAASVPVPDVSSGDASKATTGSNR
jgi:ABC-type branched-subunit amino acid transport system permease subunit